VWRKTLGANIRAERSRAGMRQSDLAAAMRAAGFDGWVQQTVGSAERGQRRIAVEELLTMATILARSVNTLIPPINALISPGNNSEMISDNGGLS
jgi:transcriptional regulator with XRE-family HTH domain